MVKRLSARAQGGGILAAALSHDPILTAAALVLTGATWMMAWVLFNIGVQLSAPRWVAGRSLAAYQAAGSGGIAIGSWGWGSLADAAGVETALLISAALMLLSPLLGRWLPMPCVGARGEEAELLKDPDVQLALTGRSGPLVVDRISSCAEECAGVPQCHAGSPALPSAPWRLWMVDRARHCRSRTVNGALSLSDLVRLPAPAQPLDAIGACARAGRGSLSHRPSSYPGSSHAGAPVWISALEGSHFPAALRMRS